MKAVLLEADKEPAKKYRERICGVSGRPMAQFSREPGGPW